MSEINWKRVSIKDWINYNIISVAIFQEERNNIRLSVAVYSKLPLQFAYVKYVKEDIYSIENFSRLLNNAVKYAEKHTGSIKPDDAKLIALCTERDTDYKLISNMEMFRD
jgi:hypothetical protein